jgi:hypothetical protein
LQELRLLLERRPYLLQELQELHLLLGPLLLLERHPYLLLVLLLLLLHLLPLLRLLRL